MKRTATVEIDLDGGDVWPADEILRVAIVATLEGLAIWTPRARDRDDAVVLDEARVSSLESA